jgi:nucleoid-associated protein YgaU
MAELEVTRPKSSTDGPRLIIRAAADVFQAPFAPREVTYSNFGGVWNEVKRPNRKPILTREGLNMRKISMSSLFVGHTAYYTSVDMNLRKLEKIAESKELVQIEYDPRCYGDWRLTSLSYTSVLRHPVTNEITRATVDLEFTEANDNGENPVSSTTTRPKMYTVKAGDTLGSIAKQFYKGDGTKWRAIAKANDIKNPKHLTVGMRLRLP